MQKHYFPGVNVPVKCCRSNHIRRWASASHYENKIVLNSTKRDNIILYMYVVLYVYLYAAELFISPYSLRAV